MMEIQVMITGTFWMISKTLLKRRTKRWDPKFNPRNAKVSSLVKSLKNEIRQFSDSIQDLIDSLESKINLWCLDGGNSSDDYRTVPKDLKNIVEA